MWVWVSLCKYILIFIRVPRFPNWYVVMRGQALVRGTQIYSYQCHIFVDNNCHYCDYLSLYKSHYWFKIIWKYFPQWYNKGYHWLFKGSYYLTFHFYQEGDWLWDISPTLTTTLGWTDYFQFWLGYSVKFFVCLFVCRLHYFLQKNNNLFENIVGDLWRILSWRSKCTKLFSRTVLCQGELFFEAYFSNFCILFPCLFFRLVMFFYVSQFLENHSTTSHQFVLQMYLVLPWGLFWGYDILFLRAVLPYLMNFCTYVICITMGLILGIVLSVLRNLRDFFDILHRCLDIIVLVTKLKNLLGFHLLWIFAGFFRLFCSMFLKW